MKKMLLLMSLIVLLFPALGLAADIRSAEVVKESEEPHNLYLAGERPTVDANVTGDLVVAGGDVTVNGDVEGGVLAAGGTLTINGNVGQSVRIAGGTIKLNGTIGGDLVVFGGDVILDTKSVVTGDVISFAGSLSLKGLVKGDVKKSYAGSISLAGEVAGNVEGSKVDSLRVEPTAVIGGDLAYSSTREADISDDAVIGGDITYNKVQSYEKPNTFGLNLGGAIFGAMIALVTLLVFSYVAPKFAKNVVTGAIEKPAMKLGIGFVTLIVAPVAMMFIAITILGIGIVGYLGLTYAIFIALASTLSALLIGSYAWKFINKGKDLEVNWKTVALGVALVALLKVVPVLGWLVLTLVFLLMFGNLTTMFYGYLKSQRA